MVSPIVLLSGWAQRCPQGLALVAGGERVVGSTATPRTQDKYPCG